jgi:hypothetical protein
MTFFFSLPQRESSGSLRVHPQLTSQASFPTFESSDLSRLNSLGSFEEPGQLWDCPDIGSFPSNSSLNQLEVIKKNLEVVEKVRKSYKVQKSVPKMKRFRE